MQTPPRRRILLVDDDPRLLAVLQALMAEYSSGRWQVQSAQDTAKALAILQEGAIDLVLLDVHMPVVDGVQFLRLIHRRYPSLAKVILTGDATGAHRQACLDSGADLYLEKPRVANGWQSVFATIEQLTGLQSPESGFRGVLRRVELQDVLQMECLARSSSIFEVTDGKVAGRIYIQDGNFIHAEIADKTGEQALNSVLALNRGEFSLHPFSDPERRTIEGQWEFLLMEAARQRDESSELAAEPAPPLTNEALLDNAIDSGSASWPLEPTKPLENLDRPVPTKPLIEEVLLCSNQGDVWHEWQSTRPEARIQLLTLLRHKAIQLSEGLSLGQPTLLEIAQPNARVLVELKSNCSLFVRSSRVESPDEAIVVS